MLLWAQLKALKSMKLKGILYLILSIAAGFFGTIWLVILLTDIVIPDENLIVWNSGVFSNFSFIAFVVEIALIVFAVLKLIECGIVYFMQKSRNKDDELEKKVNKNLDFEDGWKKAVALLIAIFVAFNALLCYFVLVDNTLFTETNIINSSVINPVGTKYEYSNVLSYDFDDDGYNNAMLVLHMKNGGKIKVGNFDNIGGAGDNYEKTDFDYLVRIDEILQDLNVEKNVKCFPDDFAYYNEQKSNLDILIN